MEDQNTKMDNPSSFSPRIVGSLRPDFNSLVSFLDFPAFKGKKDEAFALAIYDYLTSTTDGTYHFWSISETDSYPQIRGKVADPIKLLNAYGFMLCGTHANMLLKIYHANGMPARVFGIPGHNLCEVYYSGAWHALDIDMWTWFRKPDGQIAGAEELSKSPESLILKNKARSNPCDLPDKTLDSNAELYAKAGTRPEGPIVQPNWETSAHTMDFRLRPGEKLIRSQREMGRFIYPTTWPDYRKSFSSEWTGKPRERYNPFRTYGNGKWIYEPNLSADFADFEEGVLINKGIIHTKNGISGPGEALFYFRSPYPFAGIPDCDLNKLPCHDGAWLSIAGKGDFKIEINDSLGNWKELVFGHDGKADKKDISPLIAGRYEFQLRISIKESAEINSLRFESYIMMAPMSLPRLSKGENEMELRLGDKYGFQTVPWPILPDFRKNEIPPLDKLLVASKNMKLDKLDDDFIMLAPAEDGRPLETVFKMEAPEGEAFKWAYALAIVKESSPNAPKKKARIGFSEDGIHFAYSEIEIENTPNDWDCTLNREEIFKKPIKAIYVSIISDTALIGLEFHGHLDCAVRKGGIPSITHRWMEKDGEKSFSPPANKMKYVIQCGEAPGGHLIEMSMPSAKK